MRSREYAESSNKAAAVREPEYSVLRMAGVILTKQRIDGQADSEIVRSEDKKTDRRE